MNRQTPVNQQNDINRQTDMSRQIETAVETLRQGGLILYPTDTIWGIGCDATDEAAVEKIYRLKQRSDSKSLIVLAADLDMVCRYVKTVPEMALTLIEINDKPMTIIYPGATGLAPNVIAPDGTAGIRVPRHEFCTRLISRFRKPVISTSANISGMPAPACFREIAPEIIRGVDCVVDARFEQAGTRRASQIIKIGLDNQVAVIRE